MSWYSSNKDPPETGQQAHPRVFRLLGLELVASQQRDGLAITSLRSSSKLVLLDCAAAPEKLAPTSRMAGHGM